LVDSFAEISRTCSSWITLLVGVADMGSNAPGQPVGCTTASTKLTTAPIPSAELAARLNTLRV